MSHPVWAPVPTDDKAGRGVLDQVSAGDAVSRSRRVRGDAGVVAQHNSRAVLASDTKSLVPMIFMLEPLL